MTVNEQYTLSRANAVEFYQLWSTHVDALERHLSSNTWARAAVTVVVIAYPIARSLIPTLFHAVVPDVVPDVVRTVLHLI